MQKVVDFYVNDVFQKRVVEIVSKPEKLSKVGEILSGPCFEDVVYSDKQKEFMKLALEKLRKGEKLNLLFSGYAGTGKTFSAKMCAFETQRPFVYLTGSLGKQKIIEMMTNLKDNCIILIDEIHNLGEKVSEIIYPAIEYGEIYLEGKRVILNNIIFIGTTTEPEKLPRPLQDRFMRIEFDEPDDILIKEILLKMSIPQELINYLVNFTTNIRILKKIISYIGMYGEIKMDNLVKVFRMMKINLYNGLSDEQEKYIEYLKKVKRTSVRNLSLVLRRSENYIKLDIESDLIRKGIIIITSKGREINPEFYGYEQLKKEGEKNHPTFTKEDKESARKWIKESKIKNLGKRNFEFENSVAEKIAKDEDPELTDYGSFADDIPIKESENNNKIFLEDL